LIAELAVYGVVSVRQLEAAGIPRGSIRTRLRTGRLHLLYPGVYAVGHPAISLHGRWLAAALACGPYGVLSHRDGGALYCIHSSARRAIDVTAPGRSRHLRTGITIHRPRSLHPDDVTLVEQIPVTTVARTLLDLAEVVRFRQLRRAFEESHRLGLFDLTAMNATLARAHGRRGRRPLSLLVAEATDPPPTRSEMEDRLNDIIRDFNLKRPAFNAGLLGWEVDALWPDECVVVELDSFEFHGKTRAQHERDRRKQLDLQLRGYTVIRLTWSMLQEPATVAAQLEVLLAKAA
jgi:very-short-patch-repair endonuclease